MSVICWIGRSETAQGEPAYKQSSPLPWQEESARFFAALKALDSYLASDAPLGCPAEKLFQGPIADALTHVGQIALLAADGWSSHSR